MLSLKAPLFQGADAPLGEEGREDMSQSPKAGNSWCLGGSTGLQHWEGSQCGAMGLLLQAPSEHAEGWGTAVLEAIIILCCIPAPH